MKQENFKEIDPNGIDQHAKGAKLDAGKTRWDLVPLDMIEGVAEILTFGAQKYTEGGWKEVRNAKERYYSAMMRHYKQMINGELIDTESGQPHWKHFLTNAIFLGYFFDKDLKNGTK